MGGYGVSSVGALIYELEEEEEGEPYKVVDGLVLGAVGGGYCVMEPMQWRTEMGGSLTRPGGRGSSFL